MATVRAQTKTTRIPKFGSSRIPLPGSTIPIPTRIATKLHNPQPKPEPVTSTPESEISITRADLGKRVLISKNNEGILRYIGDVEFASGSWAGVELNDNVGKHDGFVNGTRYFACPPGHGLMIPLHKVSLVDTPSDQDFSGPYSMIFGLEETEDAEANATLTNISITATPTGPANTTQKIIRSRTFDKIEISPEKNECTYTKVNTPGHGQGQCPSQLSQTTFIANQLNNSNINGTFQILDKDLKDNPTYNIGYVPEILGDNASFGETTIIVNKFNTTVVVNAPDLIQNTPQAVTIQKQYLDATFNKDLSRNPDETFVNLAKTDNAKTYELNDTIRVQPGKSLASKRRNFVLDLPNNYPDFKPQSSTPEDDIVLRKFRPSPSHLDDDSNKRDSLEFEESLGILTPDQMLDATGLGASRTPSSENIRLLPHDNESSAVGEYSLGLIDLSNVTMNLQLVSQARLEQTPSPEELPLDPTPLQDPKDKKAPNSFITSITSITSLDTGYQGDGEMSRPASRGADNSPLTRRPQPRQPPRRADPMTDSDFYTESDADNHEDNPLRGDRKAQVIDGTLYGVDAQATADLYANNRENMDSSGIFTDIERTEDISSADNDVNDVNDIVQGDVDQMQVELSPSDSSTQTISDDSQTHVNITFDKTNSPPLNLNTTLKTPSPPQVQIDPEVVSNASTRTSVSTPNSIRSTRSAARLEDNKHKMPKRNVASKVKTLIEPGNKENARATPKKAGPGRWDAVMNKISAPDPRKGFKEVKSKVFSSLNTNVPRSNEKKPEVQKPSLNNRRIRSRVITPSPRQTGSISSSLSDLSAASRTPKTTPGSAKKREVLKVTQVLNGTKVQPKIGPNEARNNSKNLLSNKDTKEKKKEIIKDTGRATVKSSLVTTTPNRPQTQTQLQLQQQQQQQQQRAVVAKPQLPAPRTAEALAVLVQHLVFELEAFKNPGLRKEAEKAKLEAEEARMACGILEESLGQHQQRHSNIIQEERNKYRMEISHLIEKHRTEVIELNTKHQQVLNRVDIDQNTMKNSLTSQHEEQMRHIKVEFEKLQKAHDEALVIFREENDAIREEIDEKNDKIRSLEHFKHESEKLRHDYEAKEVKLQEAYEEIARLREEKEAWFAQRCDGDTSFQEVQSLRVVLELKQGEVADLRKLLAEASHKADQLPAAEEKIALLTAKCEDLQHQLERKNESELSLYNENKKLNESMKEELNQRQRLRQHNEELQWRLQQNKEVFKVLEGADQSFTRTLISSSFNERHSTSKHTNFERALSFRERKMSTMSSSSRMSRSSLDADADLDDISPPSSPKVKGVVEKSDSVSYVLEMDESPETVASRIVRRSFRNATPPKNTPTKSPANKRPRKNSLMQSSSATNIPTNRDDVCGMRPNSARTGVTEDFEWVPAVNSSPYDNHRFTDKQFCIRDYDEEDILDLRLPELPSEIGRKHGNTLPVPKHLAGEAMISESNSEDESSSSSSSGQL